MVLPNRFPFYPECVPRELKRGPWVGCDRAKVPQIAGTNRRASSTNRETWRSYQAAVAAYEAGRHAGVGRVIRHGEGLVGIDLDDVRDPESGVISAEAREVLELLSSYSELSPSGSGVKVWVHGRLDRSYVKPGVEVYCRGRYFALTGQILPQYPGTIEEREEEVLELVEREFPRPGRGCSAVTGVSYRGRRGGVDLAAYLASPGVEVLSEVHDSLGVKYAVLCPWAEEHTDRDESGTYVGQREGGGLWFACWHAHCAHRGWQEFRQALRGKVVRITRPAGSPENERTVNISRE